VIAGDVSEHGDAAVGLGARLGDELDSSGSHSLIRRVEVLHAQEQPDASGELMSDHGGLVLAFARPSFVSDGESSTSSKPSMPTKKSIAGS
jgi:hypothetical protein